MAVGGRGPPVSPLASGVVPRSLCIYYHYYYYYHDHSQWPMAKRQRGRPALAKRRLADHQGPPVPFTLCSRRSLFVMGRTPSVSPRYFHPTARFAPPSFLPSFTGQPRRTTGHNRVMISTNMHTDEFRVKACLEVHLDAVQSNCRY